jgi:hypothetical protein
LTSPHERNGALEAVDRIVNRGGEADEVLRETLAVLGQLYPSVAIRLPDEPEHEHGTERYPIEFDGTKVAELEVAATSPDDAAFLNRVATLISAHCRGW